ncbi:MAG: tetratricopeptide repeat protein [Terrimicrobiaceae bacterium]
MQPVPRIFVSATSRDLRTARGLVSEGLRRMECLPIVQDDFPPDYKSVRDMLRTKIATCDAVVHLAGFYYGAEPQPVLPGPDRRSFTQMEYEIAVEMKKPCYVFLCGQDFPFDKHDPEPEDKQQLQRDHRARLLQRDELFYEFATPEELSSRTRELQLSVENLRAELARERSRRRLTLGVAVAAILIALGGGIYLMGRQGEQAKVIAATNLKLEKQGALIEQLLAEQARLRKGGATDVQQIAMQAERNVAQANNQPVEDIRRTVEDAIVEAQQAVADARAGKGGLAAALRRAAEKSAKGKVDTGANRDLAAALQRLADAQLAAGHVNESIDAQIERLTLIDRDKQPEVWAQATETLALTLFHRDVMSSKPQEMLREAVEWARTNPDLGPENPTTLALTSSLSRIIVEPIDEAVTLSRFVLSARERDLGPDDPLTLQSTVDLANILTSSARQTRSKDDAVEAEALFRRAVKVSKAKLGPESPATLDAMSSLAYGIRSSKPEEAEELYQTILAVRERTLGPDDQDTLNPVLMLAFLREDQGDYPGAIRLARRALEANERTLGPDNPESLTSTTILAGLLSRSKKEENLAETEALYRKILDIRIRTFGASQPDTLDAFDNLATFLQNHGQTTEAKELNLRRLEEQGKVVGDDDTGYALELFIAASQYFIADDPATAQPLAERALKIQERNLGLDDKNTQSTVSLLASILTANGQTEAAAALKKRALRPDAAE